MENKSKTSTWNRHKNNNHVENCWYCNQTNGNLTLEQEKTLVETINKAVEERKLAKAIK